MAFQQGLSGLYAASKALDVTSNNVANSATVGFKTAQAHFADVFANSLSGSGAAQVGIGTSVGGIQQSFTQGNITTTNNPLDLSINGGGFYRMSNNGSVTYSRNGQFHLDKDGYVIDDRARRLTGYPVLSGVVIQSAPEDLKLSSANIDPLATGKSSIGGTYSGVRASLNLDSRSKVPTVPFAYNAGVIDPQSYNFSTSTSIFDSLGNAHTLTMYAVRTTIEGTTTLAESASAVALAADPANADIVAADAAVTASVTANATLATANTALAAALAASPQVQADIDAATTAVETASAAAVSAAEAADTASQTAYDNAVSATAPPASAAVIAATSSLAAATESLVNATVFADANPGLSQWRLYSSVDNTNPTNVTGSPIDLGFNTSGQLMTGAPGGTLIDIDLNAVMAGLTPSQTNIATSPFSFKLDFASSTQFGAASGTNSLQQDGYTSGRLTGVSVAADGTVRGNYSNGQAKDMGQVVLANFTNPNGLASLGGNQWSETSASGPALVGAPSTGTLGVLQSAAVEESNTDLTAELVNMITQQRNYQANAQSIKTQDQIMQTLVNLR